MFESGPVTTTAALEALVSTLSRVDADVSDAERIDQLGLLEQVKSACAAAQARITVDFADSQEDVAAAWNERAREAADGDDFEGWRTAREQARRATVETAEAAEAWTRPGRRCRRPDQAVGVAGQVALARRESPSQGSRHVTTALALVRQMPRTLAALESGVLSEWRAAVIVRETAVLTAEQRTAADDELASTIGDELGMLGDRELARRVQAIAYRIDAASVVARSRAAEKDRRVTIRPAPDTMAYVTALLPWRRRWRRMRR
ncbi:MAG: 13E12 repeat family protein [Actinomycetota bacterium]|nr:13E12 repeat family protein [Actinomycetota bacterium]